MKLFKGVFIQTNWNRHKKSHFLEGVVDYSIEAENIEEALTKMLTHFYSELWFGGDGSGDISIEDFKLFDSAGMEKELREHQCDFDYFLNEVEEDFEIQKFNI